MSKSKLIEIGTITYPSRSAAIRNYLTRMNKTKSHTYGQATTIASVAKLTGTAPSHVYEVYDRMVKAEAITDWMNRGVREIKQYYTPKGAKPEANLEMTVMEVDPAAERPF